MSLSAPHNNLQLLRELKSNRKTHETVVEAPIKSAEAKLAMVTAFKK